MPDNLPSLILTGASGIVGRNFLKVAQDRFQIYAIARRAQRRAGVPNHPNIRWIQVDIANREVLKRVARNIAHEGGADYVIHLAAYYDFENDDRPEFLHTNVNGTRHMLEVAKSLGVDHFIFTSSVAACEFPAPGKAITEDSPANADFPYARSKRIGEELMREYSQWFRCSTVRLAAVFSDWCEYAPLYMFLNTWLAEGWMSRILGGRGESAVPYIHARDVNRLFFLLLERGDELPNPGLYMASPDGATNHRELFDLATRFHHGRTIKPVLMPKILALPGVIARDYLGRLLGRRPFERRWMMDYLDRSLTIDASKTRRILDWAPTPRFHILRRTLFMIEKMKSFPQEWDLRNEWAMKKPPTRPALVIHDCMMEARDAIVDIIVSYLQSPARHDRFPNYEVMPYKELRWYVGIVYELLMAAVRTSDRTQLLQYIRQLAQRRFAGGFPPSEVCDALLVVSEITVEELLYKPAVEPYKDSVRDSINLSLALAIDGVQDIYDSRRHTTPALADALAEDESGPDLEKIVEKLNVFYRTGDTTSVDLPSS